MLSALIRQATLRQPRRTNYCPTRPIQLVAIEQTSIANKCVIQFKGKSPGTT
jgi:hypothetical protein